ncbi:MAG TPA: DNA-3-methyladenine glycosylase [Anaeromyxobacteraceae bacterium]|nr:DNA-3-methyladenine glycosylase [Anaeromyxobacteraceae bacterium]
MGARLPLDFFARDTRAVARDLLGKVLVHQDGRVRRAVRLVETEAYHGPRDRASHARFGPTERVAPMFGPPGRTYVYRVYGIHHCLNLVTGPEGFPAAVLLRGGEPVEGCLHDPRGPGNLCRALGVETGRHGGLDLSDGPIWVEDGPPPPGPIVRTPRIGVDYAGTWALRPWRYVVAGSPFASGPRIRLRAGRERSISSRE